MVVVGGAGFSHLGPGNMCFAPGKLRVGVSCLGNPPERKSPPAGARGGLLVGELRPAGPASSSVPGGPWWGSRCVTRACLPVPRRPFIKLKENGRANISRSSSSTSSFSSTAGEGEVMEECDSGVGVAPSNPGGKGGHPGPSQTPLCAPT